MIDRINSEYGGRNGTEEPAQRQLRVKNEKELDVTFLLYGGGGVMG